MKLKQIFQLLFFEHRYLVWYHTCVHQLFNMDSKHSNAGKGVSKFWFRAYFLFHDKKRVTFVIFLYFLQTSIFYMSLNKN